MTLPTPRDFLTSLLTTLTTSSLPLVEQKIVVNEPYSKDSGPVNKLKRLKPSQRALLTTLHVVFPPPMLLQALDLLDRGLVTKIILGEGFDESEAVEKEIVEEKEPDVSPPQAHIHLRSPPPPLSESTFESGNIQLAKDEVEKGKQQNRNDAFLVRSSQPPKSRFNSTSLSTATYTVHLHAWNCSCAAFAFSAFPSTYKSSPPWAISSLSLEEDAQYVERLRARGKEKTEKTKEWEFGGICADGKDGGSVPVCKHLLACLLGSKWTEVLGDFVRVREVGREEMAGLMAEG